MRLVCLMLVTSAFALCVPGCGGDSGGPAAPAAVTVYIGSNPREDGTVRSDGVIFQGGVSTGDQDCLGNFLHTRQFFSFYLKPLVPLNATITSATLMVYQERSEGSPYLLGSILVDHVQYGTQLTADAFGDMVDVTPSIGVLSTDANIGYKELDVTEAVRADHAGDRHSQFRVRFPAPWNNDGACDFVQLSDADLKISVSSGAAPLLRVQFTEP